MIAFRKALILSHRYLGILLSLMFLMWFVTGIGMIYSRGMPRLTPQVRLSRLSPLELSNIKLTPVDAAARAHVEKVVRQPRLCIEARLALPAKRPDANADKRHDQQPRDNASYRSHGDHAKFPQCHCFDARPRPCRYAISASISVLPLTAAVLPLMSASV